MKAPVIYSSWLGRFIAIAVLTLSTFASAQSAQRDRGWELGLDIVYQDATTFDFDGGSKLELDEDLGLSLIFAYRYNAHLEAQFAFDWNSVDYSGQLVLQDRTSRRASGDMDTFTPRFDVHFNLLSKPITPYVMAGIGYAFINTDIPEGRPQTGCWWDPWYGYICTDYQDTKDVEELTYQYGLGIRSDYSRTGSMRFAYERHYLDIGRTSSMPYVDQFKIGWIYRY